MNHVRNTLVAAACLALAANACNESQAKPAPKPAKTTAALPKPPPSAAEPEAKTESEPARPKTLDTQLTSERRAKIEKAHPDAKGFVVMKDLEEKLQKKSLKEKDDGIRAFDAMAKGKWVLFTGPMVKPTDDGFSIGVSYTPRMKGDRLGLSRQFFLVALKDVKGFDSKQMKDGTQVAVLAKYSGDAKASPGFELVAENDW